MARKPCRGAGSIADNTPLVANGKPRASGSQCRETHTAPGIIKAELVKKGRVHIHLPHNILSATWHRGVED